jgi:fatty acid desaturase
VVTAISVVIWFAFNSPLTALIIGLGLDFVGLLPTIKKSFERPDGEDGIAWSLESVASVLSLFAVTTWTVGIAIYPIYLVVANMLITVLIVGKVGKYFKK